jgi:hypothetical protein
MNEQNIKPPTAAWPTRWEPVNNPEIGTELGNVTAPDFQENEALTQEDPRPSLSSFAKFIVTAARIFAGCLMFLIWTVFVGPIWFCMLCRSISAYSAATVIALFTRASPPEPKRLDAVAELWPTGYQRIVVLMTRHDLPPTPFVPVDPLQAFIETLYAIFFYGGIATTIYISVSAHTTFSKSVSASPSSVAAGSAGSTQPKPWQPPPNSADVFVGKK